MSSEILKKLIKIADNQQKILAKLAQSKPIDMQLRQQWLDAVKKNAQLANNMVMFWLNFLQSYHVKPAYESYYNQIIEAVKKIQSFTVNTNIEDIFDANESLVSMIDAIQHQISYDCVRQGWCDVNDNCSNKAAEQAQTKWLNYEKNVFLPTVRNSMNLFQQIINSQKKDF